MLLAFVFPGQGSQSVGMLRTLAKLSPVIEGTFADASEVLGYDLWKRRQEGPAEALPISVPAHSSLTEPAAARLRERLGSVAVQSLEDALAEVRSPRPC
jgi:[acyl-carrier-protein] S-malonyltransferase